MEAALKNAEHIGKLIVLVNDLIKLIDNLTKQVESLERR